MYCTLQHLIDRFSREEIAAIADQNHDGEIDDELVDRALIDVGLVIDGYLSARYSLPLASVPDILVPYAVDLTWERLHRSGVPEWVLGAADRARAFLASVRDGKAVLPGLTSETPAESTAAARMVRRSGASRFDWEAN